jgi:hypothetical protein
MLRRTLKGDVESDLHAVVRSFGHQVMEVGQGPKVRMMASWPPSALPMA